MSTPVVPRHRLILLAAGIEYGVSAFFGLATFLGAFADDLPAARATLEGLLCRAVWLAFLSLGALVLARLYVGLVPGPALVLGGTPLRRRSELIPGQGNVYRSGTYRHGRRGRGDQRRGRTQLRWAHGGHGLAGGAAAAPPRAARRAHRCDRPYAAARRSRAPTPRPSRPTPRPSSKAEATRPGRSDRQGRSAENAGPESRPVAPEEPTRSTAPDPAVGNGR